MNAKYYVMNTVEFGRAIFAETDLKKGDVICYCEVLVLNEKDTKIVNTTDLQWYTFTFNDTQDCLVLGDGEIFNHSDDANTEYELINLNNRPMMVYRVIKDIKRNEQLFIDYNADVINKKEDVLASYKTNMM